MKTKTQAATLAVIAALMVSVSHVAGGRALKQSALPPSLFCVESLDVTALPGHQSENGGAFVPAAYFADHGGSLCLADGNGNCLWSSLDQCYQTIESPPAGAQWSATFDASTPFSWPWMAKTMLTGTWRCTASNGQYTPTQTVLANGVSQAFCMTKDGTNCFLADFDICEGYLPSASDGVAVIGAQNGWGTKFYPVAPSNVCALSTLTAAGTCTP